MLKTITLFVTIYICTSLSLFAQDSWKALSKSAEAYKEDGKWALAGDAYEKAWKAKESKKEFIYNAGECFYQIKDWRKASNCYKFVKANNKNFPLVGLKYARCLKQLGDFDTANRELVYFINSYQGDDKQVVKEIVENEIKGCELALQMKDTPNEFAIEYLGNGINTAANEYAPIPFNEDVLYFTSDAGNKTMFYRSQRQNGTWNNAQLPENFPEMDADHYGNGTFSPDFKRFFFTQCNDKELDKNIYDCKCEIFYTSRNDAGWTKPEKLREYINMKGVTTTHPFATQEGTTEYLFFSSNRPGGKGGMDLWYVARDLRSSDMDFTLPQNLGSIINTIGDEITPSVDIENKKIYFSSNGQVTIGGYDAFVASGNQTQWTDLKNMGFPFNSSGDDLYLTMKKGGGFYVASNREFGNDKPTTTDYDIFLIDKSEKEIVVAGKILEKSTGKPMSDVRVTLYEVAEDGQKKILDTKIVSESYSFSLLPDKDLRLEAEKFGFDVAYFKFNTFNFGSIIRYGEDIKLSQNDMHNPAETAEVFNNYPSTKKKEEAVASTTEPTKVENPKMKEEAKVEAGKATDQIAETTTTPPAKKEMKKTDESAKKEVAKVDDKSKAKEAEKTMPEKQKEEIVIVETPEKAKPEAQKVPEKKIETPKKTEVNEKETTIAEATDKNKNAEEKSSTPPQAQKMKSEEKSSNPEKVYYLSSGKNVKKLDESAKPTSPVKKETEQSNIAKTDTPTKTNTTTPPASVSVKNESNAEINYGETEASKSEVKPTNSSTKVAQKETTSSKPAKTSTYDSNASGYNYKIQIAAMKNYVASKPQFVSAAQIGSLDTEFVTELQLTRVMVANITDLTDAENKLNSLKSLGFQNAFIVAYEGTKRIGSINQ
ncbi:MAG: hypothetical protein KBA06_01485 [Saprospiraceae bacterium]|nr:hypothetical protein [Saprospiraceae bacterium]